MRESDTGRARRRALQFSSPIAALAVAIVLLCGSFACTVDDRPVDVASNAGLGGNGGGAGDADDARDSGTGGAPPEGSGGSIQVGVTSGAGGMGSVQVPAARKLDLLFMIDNSISMSDKQEVLRLAVPDLMSRLINPVCVDAGGNEYPAPAPGGECPAGQRRQFAPIEDIHVGIVSSSLGDAGANVACPSEGAPRFVPDRVDQAHLIGSLPRGQVTGANARGFLEWQAGSDLAIFNTAFQVLVSAVGERGCGWEASLEAWYRFLIDPEPPAALSRVVCDGSTSTGTNCVAPSVGADGQMLLDEELLAQRAAFLRPDSLVGVVMLTDENDCSLQVGGQSWVVVAIDDARPMFRGSSMCEVDPNDKCCYTCPLSPPEGCSADPACTSEADAGPLPNRLLPEQDGQNLRCFEQKRRFGADFLYPTQRYVNALTEPRLCWNAPDLATEGCRPEDLRDNPLFAGGRSPAQVFLAGIVGVPWQAIRATAGPSGQPLPDLDRQLRFKSSLELTSADWDRIAGSPGTAWRAASEGRPEVQSTPSAPPSEPTMLESSVPRPNVVSGNPINGRDYDTRDGLALNDIPDDLEYACIFPLPAPRDCTQRDQAVGDACDCFAGDFDRPLCEATPGNGNPGTTQIWAKAYPGLRQLHVLRALGPQAIVGSICARNTSDSGRPDFGYRPAMLAIVERLQAQLAAETGP